MSKTMGVLLVLAVVVLAAVLLGQAVDGPQEASRCMQWTVRASPLGEIGESAPEAESVDAGWEPFAGGVRDERIAGQVGRIRVRPYVFLRRCAAWSP